MQGRILFRNKIKAGEEIQGKGRREMEEDKGREGGKWTRRGERRQEEGKETRGREGVYPILIN